MSIEYIWALPLVNVLPNVRILLFSVNDEVDEVDDEEDDDDDEADEQRLLAIGDTADMLLISVGNVDLARAAALVVPDCCCCCCCWEAAVEDWLVEPLKKFINPDVFSRLA